MKRKFSTKWKASKQPRKQRKYLANAPKHIKRAMFSANLSKELRKKYNRRSFPLRKGDKVKVMRGEFKDKEGKVDSFVSRNLKVIIEGLQKTKKDGTKTNVLFSASKLQIKELNLEDKERISAIKKADSAEKTQEAKK